VKNARDPPPRGPDACSIQNMPLADGQVYAGYTILRKLGEGGMGMVYLAQHPRLPRYDALKVLPAALTVDNEYRQRFNREADIAASLWHPHIVEIHDRGELEGRLWISMDYVDGTDASSLLQTRYPHGMPPYEVVRITKAIAEALDYAHEQQLLHRDVKPSNILLSHPEEPKERIFLADFGIAKWADDSRRLTATNMAVGTVAYAAPEQLMGEHMDGRADQYALAATAFHLLTGTPVFQHTNPAVVISQHLSTPPPAIGTRRPDLRDLGPVFTKALAKAPQDRYLTCSDFADELANQLGFVAAKSGANEATAVAIPTSSRRHRASAQRVSKEPTKTQWRVVIGLLVIMTIIALVLLILHLM
jgi:serine/threonine protein kinase, bacterial